MISCPSVEKDAIRSHYDLATLFYRLLWGRHIHHGLWEADEPAPVAAKAAATNAAPGLVQKSPVRSGQQVYADNRDLTVLSAVGAGAEVIADGSIHIYGALRGRALAGAQGNEDARIFCREFHAELVAVAGHYKVLEDIPKDLRGKAVQVWLDNGQIKLAALD